MPEQLSHDGAKRLIVTGYMYHDHDNSLSNDLDFFQGRI
jgi:hypothetical protein